MTRLIAKNDYLIQEILQSKRHRVESDGSCWIIDYKTKQWRRWDKKQNKKNNKGQHYFCVSYKCKTICVHRLIYAKFVGKLKKHLQINHIDGNPSNNRPENLELVTQSQNQIHRFRVLKSPAVIGRSKINYEVANEIRELRKSGAKYLDLAAQFNLSKSTISYIVNKRTWSK